jgi:hypothetical protein
MVPSFTLMADNMSDRIAVVLSLALFLFSAHPGVTEAQSAQWKIETIKLPSPASRLFLSMDGSPDINQIRIKTRSNGWLTLKQCGGKHCADILKGDYSQTKPPANALPDAEVTRGNRNIRTAWLAGPTRRYAHGVLGDAIEAERIVVADNQDKHHSLSLPKNSVFEDRFARLADLDGNGNDEIILVKSYLKKGAALAVLSLAPEGLKIAAETTPIGRPHRWLNPAGIADYDGDNRKEIAIVVTPHIGGRLEFWEYRGGSLHKKAHLNGFSNHVIGIRAQRMSASADFNGDGITDLAVPSHNRMAIRIVSLASGSARDIERINLPGGVVTEVVAIRLPGSIRPVLIMGLDTGQLAILS